MICRKTPKSELTEVPDQNTQTHQQEGQEHQPSNDELFGG